MRCKYADFPKQKYLNGSNSCRTFQAIDCKLKNKIVFKNLSCKDKVIRKRFIDGSS